MDASEALRRARTMTGRRTLYWAGTGGIDPTTERASQDVRPAVLWAGLDPATQQELAPLAAAAGIDLDDPTAIRPACDCTGFVCWVLGFARRRPAQAPWTTPDGWIHTDTIWRDATTTQARFARLPPDRARPGALLIHPKPADRPYGHIGLVTECGPDGRASRVLHCSAENFRTLGDAIAETGTGPFDAPLLRTVVAWYRPLDPLHGPSGGAAPPR